MTSFDTQLDAERPVRWIGSDIVRECTGGVVFLAFAVFYVCVLVGGLSYIETPRNVAIVLAAALVPGLVLKPVRRRVRLFLAIVLCTCLVLVLGEMTFRLRYFGADAIVHPLKYTPVANANVPGMVVVSDDPTRGYEHRPGFEGLLKGRPVRINHWGYRDREFSPERVDGVLRIVILGDSFAMASGCAVEDGFARQFEALLREQGVEAEVFNLAMAGYSLEQSQRVLETDGVALKPDIVMLSVLAGTVLDRRETNPVDWQDVVEANQAFKERVTLIRYYSFLRNTLPPRTVLEKRIESLISLVRPSKDDQRPPSPAMPYLLQRMRQLGDEHSFEPVFLALLLADFRPASLDLHDRQVLKIAEQCEVAQVKLIDTAPYLPRSGISTDYILYPGDLHPNARTNALYARAAFDGLARAGLIPADPIGEQVSR